VLEVSSFQLERIADFKPHISIILNITDDHLDRYRTFEDYRREKLKIFANQDKNDILILNYDAANLRDLKERPNSRVLFYSRSGGIPAEMVDGEEGTSGAYVKKSGIYCLLDGKEKYICAVNDIRLKGLHNIENVLVSALAAIIVGVSDVTIRNTVRNFKGLRHRFETVAFVDGVEYIDDSKGTTVDSTYRALESCDKDVILIAGGKDKNSDYSIIRDIMEKKVRRLILIGEAASKIKSAVGDVVRAVEAKDMNDAVRTAHRFAAGHEIVLLSPMCSSFDMFKDYKERGEVFKRAVMSLRPSAEKISI